MIKVSLLAYSQWNKDLEIEKDFERRSHPQHITATGKRICQSAQSLSEIMEEEEQIKRRNIATLKSGHLGVFEHITFTFLIEGGSRVMTHQLVRHRMASYLHQSQRAVPMASLELIVPPTIPGDMRQRWFEAMQNCYQLYVRLEELGIPRGDARYIMPHGMETRIWMTVNARSLLHFFKERLINPGAQWEIKEVAKQMHTAVMKICPTIFDLQYREYWE